MLADATGLLLAAGALTLKAAAPIMHLRNLNLHVNTAIEDGRRGNVALTAPRQLRLIAVATPQAIAGTSSFGMSGVNAHAVLAVPTECREQSVVRRWCLTRKKRKTKLDFSAPPRLQSEVHTCQSGSVDLARCSNCQSCWLRRSTLSGTCNARATT